MGYYEDHYNKMQEAKAERIFAESFKKDVVDILTTQRDELLEALKSLHNRAAYMAHQCGYYQSDVEELVDAKAAIAKCESK